MAFRKDAGTIFKLKKGKHMLKITPGKQRRNSLLLNKVMITNDLSKVPPNRFMW
jgi:hypothetical protein